MKNFNDNDLSLSEDEHSSSHNWNENHSEDDSSAEMTTFEEADSEELNISEEKQKEVKKGKNMKFVLGAVGAVVAIGAGYFGYTTLSDNSSVYEEEIVTAKPKEFEKPKPTPVEKVAKVTKEKEVEKEVIQPKEDFNSENNNFALNDDFSKENDFSKEQNFDLNKNEENKDFSTLEETVNIEQPIKEDKSVAKEQVEKAVVKQEQPKYEDHKPQVDYQNENNRNFEENLQKQQSQFSSEIEKQSSFIEQEISKISYSLDTFGQDLRRVENMAKENQNKVKFYGEEISLNKKEIEGLKEEIQQLKSQVALIADKPCNCETSKKEEVKVSKQKIEIVPSTSSKEVKKENSKKQSGNFIQFVGKKVEEKLPDAVKTNVSSTSKVQKVKVETVSTPAMKIRSILSGIAWVVDGSGQTKTYTQGDYLNGKQIGTIDVHSGIYDTEGNKLLDIR